jgi:hypothetical protein
MTSVGFDTTTRPPSGDGHIARIITAAFLTYSHAGAS